MSPASKNSILHDRAQMFTSVRSFFAARSVLEVDTPMLSPTAPVDCHIDIMRVDKMGYLHSSAEYGMKKLLALGIGDIYQLSHTFRAEESSPLHSPEFTMLEWYRIKLSYQELIEETLDLIRLFFSPLPSEQLSYREAFLRYVGFDCFEPQNFAQIASDHKLDIVSDASWDKDTWLNLLFSLIVEPHLGKEKLTVIDSYPASQAALAKVAVVDGHAVARRFEIYYRGIELANGYDELTDSQQQRSRFLENNEKRIAMGKEAYPIDEEFLWALEQGLPDCRGVAVGFDRLMLLRHNVSHINAVLPILEQLESGVPH